MKTQARLNSVDLVHIGKREKSGLQIFEKLRQYNFVVKEWDVLDGKEKLFGIDKANVIVVNIGTTNFEFDDLLSDLFDKDIKIIINEAMLTNKLTGIKRKSWERHLLNKVDPNFSLMPDLSKNKEDQYKAVDFKLNGINNVWILAASIGGPEAISEFLNEFTGKEKTFFIIIQHMDKEFLPMMAKQFNQSCKLSVTIPLSGMQIGSTNCIVFPTNENVRFTQDGTIELEELTKIYPYTPCIDECTRQLVKNIIGVNIAIFSGMSTDGIEAASSIKNAGNKVITQTKSSCVLSTIITGIKDNIKVDFEGTPKQMAQYIIEENLNGK